MMMRMGNSSSTKVVSKSTVQLKFAFGKIVPLKDVLRLPDIRKNLFFWSSFI